MVVERMWTFSAPDKANESVKEEAASVKEDGGSEKCENY